MEDDELRRLFAEMRQETAEAIAGLRTETAEAIATLRKETGIRFEQVERNFGLVGDGFRTLYEKLDREATDIRLEMRQGFADTHAMVKSLFGNLDRRVTALEQK